MPATETRAARAARWRPALIAVAAAGLAGVVVARYARAEVRGMSMVPALHPGDRVLVRRWQPIRRGDIVLFRAPDGREVIKRLAGGPGDPVDLGRGPERLGAGEVAVLGDNAQASTDSRRWGPGPIGAVRGRVVGIYHPAHRRTRW